MASAAGTLTAVYTIYKSGDVTIKTDEPNLGMAYAVPRGTEQSVVDDYGPWQEAQLSEHLVADSSIFGTTLLDLELIVSWRFSQAHQYIIDANVSKIIRTLGPAADLTITARFSPPMLYDRDLEAYEIPFEIDILFSPIGTPCNALLSGFIRADGSGMHRVKNADGSGLLRVVN